MKKYAVIATIVGCLAWLASPASAQDYRARIQGTVVDAGGGVLPGVTVTLKNDATGVSTTHVTNGEGRYVFDFVDPGTYSLRAELEGFQAAEQKNVRVQQRNALTVDLKLAIGGIEETIMVVAEPVSVQFKTSSSDITLEKELIDQTPISGRNPYNLASLDPSIVVSPGTSENRPYHHAYANDYDAGGGTRRANDVLLDGVPLGASFKTAYTPAVDAVEEVTVSKNSVDAENGHSLGGVISLNMKSGTNELHGSAYTNQRDPQLNARTDPTLAVAPGTKPLRGSKLSMFGGTAGLPIKRNKMFSFSSFENWDDTRPLSIVRTVPTELERNGNFSQSVLNGRVRAIYNPFSSTRDPVTGRVVRTPFAGNVIPSSLFDPVALKMLQQIPLPNVPGNVDNWQGSVDEKVDYWNFSQRVDLNLTDNIKMFARYGQFKANLYQQNPTDAGFFPLSGSNRYGMSFAADAVWVMSAKTTLNVRGSYYNMTDEFYNPSLLLGNDGLAGYWSTPWYSSLYNSGYVYYPALDVTSGTGTGTANRLGRQGREWFQRPDAWTISARMNRYEGHHSLKGGGEVRAYYGEAARFEPINLVFNSVMTANSSDSPDTVGSGNQWAGFLLGGLDNQTTARLVPLQTPNLRGYSAYLQDDYDVTPRLTLNLGLRWEFEPGPTDKENRLSQRLDLTSPIPEMQAAPPVMPALAASLMASKGYRYSYNGAWVFTSTSNPHAWHSTWKNFMPRVGVNFKLDDASVVRVAYARFMMPTSSVRDTLGDFVNQYAGYAQTTATLPVSNGVPQQTLANPYPANNPVIEPYGQAYGRYTNLGGNAILDKYELRPQINDRFNVSYQRELWFKTIVDVNYFFNWGSRVPYSVDLNMMDPAFRYELKTQITSSVANPFQGYLTPSTFPGSLRNNATVALSQLLKPYPQYLSIVQTNTDDGRHMKTHSFDVRAQRPFSNGLSVLVAYAFSRDRIQNWYDDIAQYKILQSGGKEGWTWEPVNNIGGVSGQAGGTPEHRVTTAVTWQIPVGRGRALGEQMPVLLDAFVGGWQWSTAGRWYSGRPLIFNSCGFTTTTAPSCGGPNYTVDGSPKLANPTRDRWFDTSVFHIKSDVNTPRTAPVYFDGLTGPSATFVDMVLTKAFQLPAGKRLEARIESYNVFDKIVWEDPDLNIASANFGKVTRKRIDGNGREFQIGIRFVF